MDRKFLRLAILMAICALPAVLFAGGNREVVTKVILTAPISYISPVSTVAEKKTLSIAGIQLQIDKNGVIKKYEFAVYDKSGTVIFSKAEENLQGRGFFGDALNIGAVPSVNLPNAISWAAVDSTGKQVADGDYTYQLTATDNWGFTASSAPLSVVVDTKAPAIQTLSLSRSVVSPDGDGKNDNLTIRHITGPAANWIEEIKDSNGVSVFRKEYKSDSVEIQMSESTEWDPAPTPVLPEGSYVYTLRGLDFAANAVEKTLNFKVSYASGDISLETNGASISFDPPQSVVLTSSVTADQGATTWKLEIEDSSGVVWRRFSGQGLAPSSLSFDGMGNARDPSTGTDKLRDGSYSAVISQEYESGLVINSPAVEIVIDTSKPVEIVEPTEVPFHFYLPSIGIETASLFELGSADENPVTFTLSGIQATPKLGWKLSVRDTKGNELWSVDSAHTPESGETGTDSDSSSLETQVLEIAEAATGAVDDPAESAEATDTAVAETTAETAEVATAPADVPELETPATDAEVAAQTADADVAAETASPDTADAQTTDVEVTVAEVAAQTANAEPATAETASPDTAGTTADAQATEVEVAATIAAKPASEEVASGAEAVEIANSEAATDPGAGAAALEPAITADAVESEIVAGDGENDVSVRAELEKILVAATTGDETPIRIVWDGKDSSGAIIPGAESYEAVLSFTDENGNSLGEITKKFISSIPVVSEDEYLKISVPDVLFDGNESNPIVNNADQRDANRSVLYRLGTALSQLEGYKIVLAGYATYTNGFTQASMDREQRLELIPLSEHRATEVKEALFLFGIDWDRFAVLARGGTDPVVPYTDTVNRYLNRRVVFLLEQ